MVLTYYQLAEQPFGVTPDPLFLFQSSTHREAISSVLYAVKAGRGFTALIAEPGMGKTTILFNLLRQLGESTRTAFLFQAQDSPKNFLRNLLADLGIEDDGQDLVGMQAKLNECLVREISQGKNFVVVVDEAQNLDDSVLEVVRMLSNFETPREKLMTIILAGQPQLAEKLGSPQLTQLRQRVSIVARLKPFNREETRAYIEHRLKVAGYRGESLFTDGAHALIAQHSWGIPRNINNICFNAMAIGCATQLRTINAAVIKEVLADLDLTPLSAPAPASKYRVSSAPLAAKILTRASSFLPKGFLPKSWRLRTGIACLAALLAGIGWTVLAKNHTSPTAAVAATVPQPQAMQFQPTQVQPTQVSPIQIQEAAGQTVSSRPEAIPLKLASARANKTVSSPQLLLIRVAEQDNLYRICMDNLGRYDQQVLKIVRELNPQFENPRRLKVGQQLRIPTRANLSSHRDPSVEEITDRSSDYELYTSTPYASHSNASAVEAKKP
jgi:type II secretory pathway predicted ATPase ExeA